MDNDQYNNKYDSTSVLEFDTDSEIGSGSDFESDVESDVESDIENNDRNNQDAHSNKLKMSREKDQLDKNQADSDADEQDHDVALKDETMDAMKKNYSHPEQSDPNIQYKLYKKREYYYNKIPKRIEVSDQTDYQTIKDYRDNICARAFTLHEHQGMLSNLINPDTPYKGILVFHGLGTGKCIHKDSLVDLIMGNADTRHKIEDIWEKYKTVEIYHQTDEMNSSYWSVPSVGLTVRSYDCQTHKIVHREVKRLYREKINGTLRQINLENGNRITITNIHKLLTTSGWDNNLSVGQSVATYLPNDEIKFVRIDKIDQIEYDDYVYDLEIDTTHNYFAENILCHNTCVGVAIAEKFKPMVQKYNTKIYVLVPGPIIKENWRNHLLLCTGETYLKYQDKYVYMDANEKARQNKVAVAQALQYYKIMSYRSFYKRVLGEKILDRKVSKGHKIKTVYRKSKEGEFERDVAVDRIYNLNNSLIIIDEAHNLTGNAYGKALEKIIHNSKNLKVVLMTGTPAKNLGSDIIELINFLRPKEYPMERDKVFNSHKNHLMDFRQGGLEYFKNMINGYVSHVRGSDPLTFAKRIDKGDIPNGLLFTNVVRCEMLEFQRKTYKSTIKEFDDALDRASEAVANFSFPGLSKSKDDGEEINLVGYYGREGLNTIREQLKVSSELLNKKIGEIFFNGKEDTDLLYVTPDGKTVTGKIYKAPYLKYFSVKFYKALKKLNRLVVGKKGAKSAFVYSNLVKVGIEVFQEVLIQNGYLEYQEDSANYQINDDTVCYYCGKSYKNHSMNRNRSTARARKVRKYDDVDDLYGGGEQDQTEDQADDQAEDQAEDDQMEGQEEDVFSEDSETDEPEEIEQPTRKNVKKVSNKGYDDEEYILKKVESVKVSESSTEYSEQSKKHFGTVPAHKFYPATFVSITGKSSEEKADVISEDKKKIIDNVFNKMENKEGKYIKLILGSRVLTEGISMRNVGEVHILDVYFNLGKVDQVVGRAIRWCSHYKTMSENNVFPYVNVYKYVVSFDKKNLDGPLTSEEDLYKKAEQKYMLIKKIERAMKERAFDCPLNMHGNIFAEEVEKFKNCDVHGDTKCPAICDYMKCDYKCDDPKLNFEYYDPDRKIYKAIPKNDLDYSTFTHGLAESEIDFAKNKIKEMYITNPVHTLHDVLEYVKNSYEEEKRDLFDEFFVFKALDSLIPITENDFNNFRDTITDKNNTQGYLIYRDDYYIFQPFDQNEDVPLYYRVNKIQDISYELSLFNYLKNSEKYKKIKDTKKKDKFDTKSKDPDEIVGYNFDETLEYYDTRDEYEFVGIIDKEISRRKTKRAEEIKDVFKIRPKLPKVLDKKRGTGIPSLKGAVCSTSKSKEYLDDIAKKLGATVKPEMTRIDVCDQIENKMLEKEKYSTDKDKNKLTYVRLPANHPKYPFPYNLEDRIKHIITKIKSEIKHSIDITTTKGLIKSGGDKGKPSYNIIIKDKKQLEEYNDFLKKQGAVLEKDKWIITVE
jgi:hypothetical protein